MEDMKTILIVDDDSEVLEILEETLIRAGYDIIPKPDAESGLAVIRGGVKIDLVITDQHLPGMKGTDLVAALKQAAPTVPVIMLTGYGSVETYIQTMAGGVFEYIHKPIQAEELRRIVKAALDRPRDDHS